MIDIHVVSWNRPRMTSLVIKAIHKNTSRDKFRLMVLDNGSEQTTVDMLQNYQDNGLIDELVLWPENRGLEPARTELLRRTGSQYFICVDNDCLPEPPVDGVEWIDRLVDLVERHEGYAAVACRYPVMVGTGNIYDGHEDEELVDFPWPGGSYRIMITDLVKGVGGWRDTPSRGQEERYICGKLNEIGWKTAFAVRVRTLHLFGTQDTDNWGYNKELQPEDTGHSSGVWHPKFQEGDVYEEVVEYVGESLAKEYFR